MRLRSSGIAKRFWTALNIYVASRR
jgi:hypothetical protein